MHLRVRCADISFASRSIIRLERLEARRLFCDVGVDGLRVSAGGDAYLASTQLVWQADTGFEGGTVSTTPFNVGGTADPSLYQTRRWGNFDFHAEADNGGYTLTLLFAEPVMNRRGKRLFDVFAEDQPILTNFDLVAAAGPKTAISRRFTITVTDESIDLRFVGVVENAIVSGIELTPLPIPPATPTDLSANADSDAHVTLAWTDHANNESGFEIDRRVHGTSNWRNVGAAATDQESFIDTTAAPNVRYDYRVQAVGELGVSAFITTSITTPVGASSSTPQAAQAGPASTLLRINVGGAQYKDTAGNVWLSDRGATGGGTGTDTFAVAGTSDPYLFDTRRYGNFSYALPADDGHYTLKLSFMERVKTGVGQRVFNVLAEGTNVLSNFDIFAQAGFQAALIKSMPVTVTGSALNLTFQSITDYAIVSAIELIPSDVQIAAPLTPGPINAIAGTQRVDLSWADVSSNEAGFELERKGPNDANFVRIATLPSNVSNYADTGLKVNGTYSYRVRAINNAGPSGYTAVAQATLGGSVNLATFTKVTWTSVASSLVPRSEAQTAVVSGRLYVFGGYLNSTTLVPEARSDYYDPIANKWTQISSMTIGMTHSGTCTDGRYVYFAGGYSGPGGGGQQTFARTDVLRYDTITDSWTNLVSLPQARGAGGLVLLGRVLHFFGGTDLARQDRSEHWSFDLDHDTSWHTAAALPTLRNHLGAVVLNGKIYAVGGQQHQDAKEIAQNAVQVWDPANPGIWTSVAPLTLGRSHIAGATFVMNGRIIVLGGETTYLHSVPTNSAYDPVTNKWVDLTPLPIQRSSGNAGVINGVLYYATGVLTKNVYKGVPG